MKTAFQVWDEASQTYPSVCDDCAHKRTACTDIDRPGFADTFACGLPEARARECLAWRGYEGRYQAAHERGARDLSLVLDAQDTDLQKYLQAVLVDEPEASTGLRAFLKARVEEYAEMIS